MAAATLPITRPILHVFAAAGVIGGGERSPLTLVGALNRHWHIEFWPLSQTVSEEFRARMALLCQRFHETLPADALAPGSQVLIYLNDYGPRFCADSDIWRALLRDAAGVQFGINYHWGGLHREQWLAPLLRCIYFQNRDSRDEWAAAVANTDLAAVTTVVLPCPVDLGPFLQLPLEREDPVIIGRMAGLAAPVPPNLDQSCRELLRRLPDAQFWFMPAPAPVQAAFVGEPRVRLYARDAVSALQFLGATHIYCLALRDGYPVHGPRSLMEAMAAGCAPVVPGHHGPADRVVHGVSGFHFHDEREMVEQVVRLAEDRELRRSMGAAARLRAASWRVGEWVEAVNNMAGLG